MYVLYNEFQKLIIANMYSLMPYIKNYIKIIFEFQFSITIKHKTVIMIKCHMQYNCKYVQLNNYK